MKYCISILLVIACSYNGITQNTVTDKGIAYYTLGNDTTSIQYFEYGGNTYKTTFIQFTGSITKCQATGLLDEKGNLKQVLSSNYRISANGSWELTTNGVNTFNGDSTIYTATNPLGVVTNRRSFPGQGILANGMDIASFYVFPYMGFYAPHKSGDTLFHRQLSFTGYRNYIVTRLKKNTIRIGSNLMGYLTCFTDNKGRLQKIDGVGSSLNIKAFVEREKINTSVLDETAFRRNARGAAAVRTLRDTAQITMGNTTIELEYWRPHKRGREIFGNVVPWNRVWRTGANNATQLRITGDITIGQKVLPQGNYGIWSYPTENNWELIINKNANAWGTDHDPAADIFRVPLLVKKVDTPVEVLKISLIKLDGKRTRFLIEWDIYTAETDIITN